MHENSPFDKFPISPGPGDEGSRVSPALARFHSCRWRKGTNDETPDHCTHRDVLPIAGSTGFKPESWCPDCPYYKLRRMTRRRSTP